MGRAFEFRKTRKLKRWSQMSKAFTRIGKDIVIAVKEGGADPQTNSKLRQVMQNAKTANMPKENVLRAIKKASDKDTKNYEELKMNGIIAKGMLPKLHNCFEALENGVQEIRIGNTEIFLGNNLFTKVKK